MKAAEKGQRKAVRELLASGCNLFIKNKVLAVLLKTEQDNKTARDLATKENIKRDLDTAKDNTEKKAFLLYLYEKERLGKVPENAIKQACSYIQREFEYMYICMYVRTKNSFIARSRALKKYEKNHAKSIRFSPAVLVL